MDESPKRLSRLAAMLTLLQTKRLITATELARRFDVSIRTVYRDIRALEASGVPVVTEEGRGYSLMEGYHLPPVSFSEKEANAVITAHQMVQRSKDQSLINEFSSAVEKIMAVLRYTAKDKAQMLAERVHIGRNFFSVVNSECLMDLQMALTNYHPVQLSYKTADGRFSERMVEPFALYNNADEEWILAAYCRLRLDFRSFRLDRMISVQVLPDHFEPHGITVREYIEKYVNRPANP